jgi:PhoH-like ATPase
MKKNFVFDTNVLLHDPEAIFKFEDNNVVIPIYAIEEVDTFKKNMSELGRNARETSRLIDRYREAGNLREGVPLPGGGTLRVGFISKPLTGGVFLDTQKADNLIIAVALEMQEREPDHPCIMLSKDVNLRVRANALGLKAENYEEQSLVLSDLYSGVCEITGPVELIAALHEAGELELEAGKYPGQVNGFGAEGGRLDRFYVNEYVLIKADDGSDQSTFGRIASVEADGKRALLKPLTRAQQSAWGIKPRNKEQLFALDALLDDSVDLVTLVGKAGTGKTLLAIAAGLKKVTDEQKFQKLLVARPVIPMGRDIGYLPGTMEEKLGPWMRPIFDNVEYLMGLSRADKRAGRGADELIKMGLIEIEALTFIRGRSLPQQYIIIDEAQNLTPHEAKTILTRAGEGTKIVMTGDPYQIDNPYVDADSNGLSYVVQRFQGQPRAATVSLLKGERSPLAELAANLL